MITKYFPFPLIPTKARTTKLAQKLEKHPKPIKTMFNQWVAERTFVLILSDYVENCLNLCPSSARRETVFSRLRAAAYDYLRLARNRLYWLPVSFWWNLFHFSIYFIEFLEYSFFFELNGCRNNTFIILRYVEGDIPLRHPSCCTPNLFLKLLPKAVPCSCFPKLIPKAPPQSGCCP